MTLLEEIKALAAEMVADGRATNIQDAFILARAQIDDVLRYADQADQTRLTDPKMEAINLVAAALAGNFKLI